MPAIPSPELSPERRAALVVGIGAYGDRQLSDLRSPAHDAAAVTDALADPQLSGFKVTTLIDPAVEDLRSNVERFLLERTHDELIVLYLSCHGLLDMWGDLYFAAANTDKDLLASTALDAGWLRTRLERCKARSQVLILDCCHAGAFPGAKGLEDLQLQRTMTAARGKVVLSAARRVESAYEPHGGDSGLGTGSVFTTALLEGLVTGAADRNGDGFISVTDAFAYAEARLKERGATQTPQISLASGEGEILLARTTARVPVEATGLRREPKRIPLVKWITRRSAPTGVAFSPDSAHLAIADRDGVVRLWSARQWNSEGWRQRLGQPFMGHNGAVHAVAFSPDGTLLATTGADNTVRLWDPRTRRQVRGPLEGHTDWVREAAFSLDGTLLATAGADETVRLWDPHTGQPVDRPLELAGITESTYAVAFSPERSLVATSDGEATVHLWDLRTLKSVGTPLEVRRDLVTAMAFSPNDASLAIAGASGNVFLWDTRTCEPIGEPYTKHGNSCVSALSFSPDGQALASGDDSGEVRVWEPSTHWLIGEPLVHRTSIDELAFSPDGALLATTSADKHVSLWRVEPWTPET